MSKEEWIKKILPCVGSYQNSLTYSICESVYEKIVLPLLSEQVRSSVGNSLEEDLKKFVNKWKLKAVGAACAADEFEGEKEAFLNHRSETIFEVIKDIELLLNSTPNPEPSVATEDDQGGADCKQNLEALREKFFKECVTGSNFPVFTLRYESPDEVFNWFIPYLK